MDYIKQIGKDYFLVMPGFQHCLNISSIERVYIERNLENDKEYLKIDLINKGGVLTLNNDNKSISSSEEEFINWMKQHFLKVS